MLRIDSLGTFWVCVRTEPHREVLAESQLRQTGLEIYCPRYQRWISSGRRRQLVARPLFPNYIFARSVSGLDAMGHIKRTRGVSSLAGRDLASAIVPDLVIEGLRARETSAGIVELAADRFAAGETVKITVGPFEGFHAIFQEKQDDRRALIMLSLLGKSHSVSVLANFLEKAA